MSTISLCKRCSERISDCYRLTPIDQSTTFCILCHGRGANMYDFQPKHMQRKKIKAASAGPRADREEAMHRRRWA